MADNPFEAGTVTHAHERLDSLARKLEHYTVRLEYTNDSRCVFTCCYAMLIRALAESLRTGQGWQDSARVVELAEGFAQRYFDALDSYDAGESAGKSWDYLQGLLRERRSSVLQDFAVGLVGHIVRDLPLALEATWRSAGNASRGIDDFHRVNEVLGERILPVRDELERRYNPLLRWFDVLLPSDLKLLSDGGFRLSRAAAWYNAERLLDGSDRVAVREGIEELPIWFAAQLFRPRRRLVRWVLRTLNVLVSLGRRWPIRPVPSVPVTPTDPHQRYYFGIGVGQWRGTFRFQITDWSKFFRADMSRKHRLAAMFSATVMLFARQARLDSKLDGFPDQGPKGVATARIRVSVLGITMYSLHEQYALGTDGTAVYVRGYERIGPFGMGGGGPKAHSCWVADDGMSAYYTLPLFGTEWHGHYDIHESTNEILSKLSCEWGEAVEAIKRVA